MSKMDHGQIKLLQMQESITEEKIKLLKIKNVSTEENKKLMQKF